MRTRSNVLTHVTLALVPLLAGASLPQAAGHGDVVLTLRTGSRIWIEGDSNLHEWSCEARGFTPQLRVDRAGPGAPPTRVLAASVSVPVAAIECGNGKMNDNLRKALEASVYPTVTFQLNRSEFVDVGDPTALEVLATGRLTVAGMSRDLSLQISGADTGDGALRLTGRARIRMTDWDVHPPTAMLGLLKTDDEVTIFIDLTGAYGQPTESATRTR